MLHSWRDGRARAAVRLRRDARGLRRRAHVAVARARCRPRPRAARPSARARRASGPASRSRRTSRTTTRRPPCRSPAWPSCIARLDRWGLASNKERTLRPPRAGAAGLAPRGGAVLRRLRRARRRQLGPLLDALDLDADAVRLRRRHRATTAPARPRSALGSRSPAGTRGPGPRPEAAISSSSTRRPARRCWTAN